MEFEGLKRVHTLSIALDPFHCHLNLNLSIEVCRDQTFQ